MSLIPSPGIYSGTLRHRRFRPRDHRFTYSLFMVWLDIDKIEEQMGATPWSAYNRFGLAAFHQKDHFGQPELSLRTRLARSASEQGIALPSGPVFLLTHLRYLGYCFNPISLFYCYNEAGSPAIVLAEVNNTFGETQTYWLTAHNQVGEGKSVRYRCPKSMHVSPFMGMDLDYEFVLTRPDESLTIHMNTIERGAAPLFDATLTLTHKPWSSSHLGWALARTPWMTAKVIAAIHWEALRLFLKRVPVFTHPGKTKQALTEPMK